MRWIPAALYLMLTPLLAGEFPWSDAQVPQDIATAALHHDQVVNELPCNWRPVVKPIFAPAVRHCKTAREAVLHVAANIGALTGVYYTPTRRKHNMNALEALAEKKVSCTGQSVLLVCALRSIDIPARAVGVLSWNHVRGNHTWVEAWVDGGWHMIEFNEKNFNTPWVLENIGMLNPELPFQRIKAADSRGNTTWSPQFQDGAEKDSSFPAIDVTERYLALARKWYAQAGIPENSQRLLIDLQPRQDKAPVVELLNSDGKVITSALLPTTRDDMRYMTPLELPRMGQFNIRIGSSEPLIPVSATSQPVQIITINSSHSRFTSPYAAE